MAATASYWCYQCNRLVRVSEHPSLTCPNCSSGFIEAVTDQTSPSSPSPPDSRRRSPASSDGSDSDRRSSTIGFRRSRRASTRDRSPFNPVILLRSPQQSTTRSDDVINSSDDASNGERLYQLYYDDGSGGGLRPLPESMSEILLGAGFDRLLDQLSQLEIRHEKPPASKAAIESMPSVEIVSNHVVEDLQCAVCHESFEIGSEAKEMPCKHLYHSDCILPWLSIRNSCPVCRHELPTEMANNSSSDVVVDNADDQVHNSRNENEPVGLTIWRLPGGGYAVGRFSGVRRGENRELPVVYTEMDGGLNGHNNGVPRRVVWRSSRRNRGSGNGGNHGNGGMGRLFGNFVSFFRRFGSSSSTTASTSSSSGSTMSVSGSETESPGDSVLRSRSVSRTSVFSRYMRRSRRGWAVEEPTGMAMVRW